MMKASASRVRRCGDIAARLSETAHDSSALAQGDDRNISIHESAHESHAQFDLLVATESDYIRDNKINKETSWAPTLKG
jgi:hypothetical protein